MGLVVVGGGHSGYCLWPNVVSVDMSAFEQPHNVTERGDEEDSESLVIAEAGCRCTIGDTIRKNIASGLTVPLGARPSVGSVLWLQQGIAHLARLHRLACDATVGAVVVSVMSREVLYIGRVPS